MPPVLREPWGRRVTEITSLNGYLIVHVFPIHTPQRLSGPPYSVSVDLISRILVEATVGGGTSWEQILEIPPDASENSGIVDEMLVVWRKRSADN